MKRNFLYSVPLFETKKQKAKKREKKAKKSEKKEQKNCFNTFPSLFSSFKERERAETVFARASRGSTTVPPRPSRCVCRLVVVVFFFLLGFERE